MAGPYDSVSDYMNWLTEDSREGGSEYGGMPGTSQPYPHEMSPSETLHALYANNPADPGVDIETEEAAPSIHKE